MLKSTAKAFLLTGFLLFFAMSVGSAQSDEDLQAQLQALIQQVADLQAQLESINGGSEISSVASCRFTRDLRIGVQGDDVLCLQEYLNSTSYVVSVSGPGSPGNETTYFGPLTETAVHKWQLTHDISPAAGYFGPISRAKYSNLLSVGQEGVTGSATQPDVETVPPVQLVPKTELAPTPLQKIPIIFSVLPSEGRSGDLITITGEGFTPTNNAVSFGLFLTRGISSSDGKTLTFVLETIEHPDDFEGIESMEQFLEVLAMPEVNLTFEQFQENMTEVVEVHVENSHGLIGEPVLFKRFIKLPFE